MTVALLAGAYLIGSIPFSYLVARAFGVADVRSVGSGNVGATNVMRSAGRTAGMLAFLPLVPLASLAGIAVFAVVAGASRYVSLGSIAGTLALVLGAFWFGPAPVAWVAAATGALVVAKHRANIARLVSGTENRMGQAR